MRSCDDKKMSVVSCSNHPFLLSTSSVDGSVHVWNCCAVPKLYFNFSVDTGDELIANMFAPKITSGGGGATHGTTSKDGQTIKTRINKKQRICTNAAKISKWASNL